MVIYFCIKLTLILLAFIFIPFHFFMNLNWPHECLVSPFLSCSKGPTKSTLWLFTSSKLTWTFWYSQISSFIFFPNDLNADLDGFLVVFSDFFLKGSKREVMSDNKLGFIKIVEGWNDADSKMKHKRNKTNKFIQRISVYYVAGTWKLLEAVVDLTVTPAASLHSMYFPS